MATFYFLMQHKPTPEQISAARAMGADKVVALAPAKPEDRVGGVEYEGSISLLNVPDDPGLNRDWFVTQVAKIDDAVGGFANGDTIHAAGQGQLVNAINGIARSLGANCVESVTTRESIDRSQPDGSVKKESVFRFRGFRPVYEF